MKLTSILLALLTFSSLPTAHATADDLVHTFAETSVLAEGTWVKVQLDGKEDGVYQVTYSQLRSMGFSQPEKVGVYGFGGHALAENLELIEHDDLPEVAVYHDAKKGRILFYGQGLTEWSYDKKKGFNQRINSYEDKACYFLHQKEEAPRSMEIVPHNSEKAATWSDTYVAYEAHESDAVNIGQTGREKYGESFVNQKTQRFEVGLQDWNRFGYEEGPIRLKVNAIAHANTATKFTVKANGQDVGDINISAVSSSYTFANEGNLDKTIDLNTENGLTVTVTYEGTADLARLNYIIAEGRRKLGQPATYAAFRDAEAQGFNLGSADSSILMLDVMVWDVTSATDVKLQQLSDKGTFAQPQDGRMHKYMWVNTEASASTLPSVTKAERVTNQNLHALPYHDLVIVTAPAYFYEAQRLAEYRQTHDGLSAIVITPQQIYNEFSSGGQDATAIRLLMRKMKPRYLLLFGDGHYDNQKINRQYMLPSYETDYALAETSSCTCDDYFGFIDEGEGGKTDAQGRYTISDCTLDIGVGRLPASSVEEAKGMVDKIIAYSNNRYQGNWKTRLCFLSDDDKPGDSYNAHVRHNDQLVKSLEDAGHREYAMQKIYLPAYKQTSTASGTDYPDAKKEFMESLKQGVLLVNYAGHGNTSTITNENMMTSGIASQLNMRYLPLWVTASCDVGRWDNDDTSLGEYLTLNANGGAIAMLTTVRVVYAMQNLRLNQAIIDNLFDRNADGTRFRLGDVLKAAKRSLGTDYNKLNFCLLGDPSLTMAYPEQQIALTQVNGQKVSKDSPIQALQALETVTMKGVIYKTGSENEVDSTFNGIVFPTLYDALDTITADKGYVQDEADPYRFVTRTRKAFTGRGEVKNGHFEFSFMVPQDLAYSNNTGLATLYACSDEWAEAQGYFDRYSLTGGEEISHADTIGPEIRQLMLNDMLFTDGAVVNSTPFFYAEVADQSGFNTTGNGIGHDMVLTIKCTSNPLLSARQYILNNYFATYTGKYNIGRVQYSIPAMEDGEYEASFTVWDVYNNASRRTFHFTVGEGKAPHTLAVQAYPSPAHSGEKITFRVLHNRPESAARMQLQVFNSLGHMVYETDVRENQAPLYYALDLQRPTVANPSILADETPNFLGSTSVEWNAPALAAGFYVYRIVLTSGNSQKVSQSKVLIIEN